MYQFNENNNPRTMNPAMERSFVSNVFLWMFAALGITAATAFLFGTNESLMLFSRGGFLRFAVGVFGRRTQTAQTRATPAATSRSRLTAGCCRSRFVVAFDRGRKQRSVAAAAAARRRRERRVAAPKARLCGARACSSHEQA